MTPEVKAINQILNDIYKTNRLHDDIKEAKIDRSAKTFQTDRLNFHMRSMGILNEVFEKTDKWEGYFSGIHPITFEVRISGNRDKQNR